MLAALMESVEPMICVFAIGIGWQMTALKEFANLASLTLTRPRGTLTHLAVLLVDLIPLSLPMTLFILTALLSSIRPLSTQMETLFRILPIITANAQIKELATDHQELVLATMDTVAQLVNALVARLPPALFALATELARLLKLLLTGTTTTSTTCGMKRLLWVVFATLDSLDLTALRNNAKLAPTLFTTMMLLT